MVSLKTSALLAVVAAAPAMAANIAGNAGFETAGDSSTISAFWGAGAGGAAGTISERSSTNPFSGDWAQRLVANGAPAQGASAGISQNSINDLGLVSLAPGSSVTLSFKGNYTFGPGGVGFYTLRILNSSGAIVANTGLQVVNQGTNGYQSFSTAALTVPEFGAAPNDSFAAFVEINVVAGAFDGSTSSAFIDDVVIDATLVPAPSALGLMGAGLLVAGRRRRASK